MYFHKKKKRKERKRHILTSSVVLFSVKADDGEEDARLSPLGAVFRSFSSKKNNFFKDEKKQKN